MAGRWVRTSVTAAAVVLGVVGVSLVAVSVTGPSSAPPVSDALRGDATTEAPPRSRERSSSPPRANAGEPAGQRAGQRAAKPSGAGVPDRVAGLVLPSSDPVRLEVPALGVTSEVIGLGLDGAGSMEVPRDGSVAGWYELGPTPGALGPAVIAGHVDWEGAPGIFFRLGTMGRGDRIEITREDGDTAVFAVTQVARFPKARFPTRSVYGSTDHAGLRLITCGGAFDSSVGHYVDNIVVFARLVSRSRA